MFGGIALLLALGAGQILQHVLYRVNSIEPLVLIAAPVILFAASLLASLIPALARRESIRRRRCARSSPQIIERILDLARGLR